MKTSAKSLRLETKRILDAVERGEEVIVSKRGKPCARIVPVGKKIFGKLQDEKLFGIWKENKTVQDVEGFINFQRSRRT